MRCRMSIRESLTLVSLSLCLFLCSLDAVEFPLPSSHPSTELVKAEVELHELYMNLWDIKPSADISILVADVKYNPEQGVKICEIQTASSSSLCAYDFLQGGHGVIAQK